MKEAIRLLSSDSSITVVNTSSIYETDPVGFEEQDLFLNMAVLVSTDLNPFELLDRCQTIELDIGRIREFKWGPRTIDLDILLYNQENIVAEKLIVPHPRMHERAFVLVPLLEMNPNLRLPKMEGPLKSCLANIPYKEGVRIWKQKNGEDVFALFES